MDLEELNKLLEKAEGLQVSLESFPESPAREESVEFARRIACYIEDAIDAQEMSLHAKQAVNQEDSWDGWRS